MNEKDEMLIHSAASMLAKQFDNVNLEQVMNMEELRERLTECIVYMLLHEMEKLLFVLYRIDVNEEKTKAVFSKNDPKEIAPGLADLIIAREIEKAKSRQHHQKND